MNGRLVIADASRVTSSQFLNAFLGERKEDESSLFGKLYMAIRDKDAEAEAAARAQLDAMKPLSELRPENKHLWDGERGAAA